MPRPDWSTVPIEPLRNPPITREQLRAYAEASRDLNPIHTDDAVARERGLDGVIAHGMLSMAFIASMLTNAAGPDKVRRLRVRFGKMVRLGDVLTCHAVPVGSSEGQDGRRLIRLDVWAENQEGDRVTYGEATVLAGDVTSQETEDRAR